MPPCRVAIAGATGYAGEELIRLLARHPNVRLTYLAASAKWERPIPVSDVFPQIAHGVDLPIESLAPERLLNGVEAVFLSLPHGEAMALVPPLLAAGVRVIDLSGDFRLTDPSAYPRWYHREHPHPELLADPRVVYGLTECHRDEIRQARMVANPGCYATSVLLACVPLAREGLLREETVIVDAKSALSGAGRKADQTLLFTEMAENLRPYKVNDHQHMPEIQQELVRLTGCRVMLVFVPQVIPAARGLISMVYVKSVATAQALEDAYRRAYPPATTPFVRIRPGVLPQLRDVRLTNRCDIGFIADGTGTVVVASALDNLTKGAAGQAVQNLNVMMGWPETLGLL
jgi:N-acetyl-gamma-glutamyl-phosphate reductase